MRYVRPYCLPSIALVVGLVASAVLSCSDSETTCGGWSARGLQVVPVDSIAFQDTLCKSDTLVVAFWSGRLEDRPEFSHFNLEADPARLEITAWAQVYEWVGSGSMPPVDQVVLDGDQFVVPPPLPSGTVEIAVRQPNDSVLVDTTVVEICPETVYSCSFESEMEIADWSIRGNHELTDDVPLGGGSTSIWVSGIDVFPHARYVIPPADKDGYYVLLCWAKKELPVASPECGGLVSLTLREEPGIELCVLAWEWTRYGSLDTLFCPAGEELLIELSGGGHLASPPTKLYVDLLEVWRLSR